MKLGLFIFIFQHSASVESALNKFRISVCFLHNLYYILEENWTMNALCKKLKKGNISGKKE